MQVQMKDKCSISFDDRVDKKGSSKLKLNLNTKRSLEIDLKTENTPKFDN